MWTDFRLRSLIFVGLKTKLDHASRDEKENVAFQLSICHYLGIGTPRDLQQAEIQLQRCLRTKQDIHAALSFTDDDKVFQPGKFLDLFNKGFINPIDYAQYYREAGLQSTALKEYARTIADFNASLGAEHLLVINLKEVFAGMLEDEGLYIPAAKLLHEVLPERERVSEIHPATLWTQSRLASILKAQGKLEEAERLAISSLNRSRLLFKSENPKAFISLASLASLTSIFEVQGRWREVKELDRQILQGYTAAYGREHPSTIVAQGNLASTLGTCALQDPVKLKEVEAMLLETVALSKEFIGPTHPNTLQNICKLAGTYNQQKRFQEAGMLYRKAQDIFISTLGTSHLDAIINSCNLAINLIKQQRFEEAEELLVQALSLSETTFEKNPLEHLGIFHTLTEVYRAQSKLEAAEVFGLVVLDQRTKLLGSRHPETINSQISLGTTYYHEGRLSDAQNIFWDAVNGSLECHGGKHPVTLQISHNLAVCLHEMGEHQDAVFLMKDVIERERDINVSTSISVQMLDRWQQRAPS